jgi:hypothetical protein
MCNHGDRRLVVRAHFFNLQRPLRLVTHDQPGCRHPAPISIARWLIAENEGLRLSTWGVFGWMSVLAAPELCRFFDLLALIGMVGMIVAIVQRLGQPMKSGAVIGLA